MSSSNVIPRSGEGRGSDEDVPAPSGFGATGPLDAPANAHELRPVWGLRASWTPAAAHGLGFLRSFSRPNASGSKKLAWASLMVAGSRLHNTEVHRQKSRDVERDRRVTLMIWDRNDPYRFVEVRGDVVEKVRGPEARKHIAEVSQKYRGGSYQTPIRSERVVLRIAPL
jgi:predicted protein tyrosine phosphatase